MRYRLVVTLLASLVAGIGAAMLSNRAEATARDESGYECGAGAICNVVSEKSCRYGQKDQYDNCDISWPPPCPTCNDDCCVTVDPQ